MEGDAMQHNPQAPAIDDNQSVTNARWWLVFLERVSLFAALYVVTVSLFWFETGLLSKGLMFGFVAAGLKTGIAKGHNRFFSRFEELNPANCHNCRESNE
ncbi:MAG: hypothetical protein AB8G99_20295 [Planctomycetaceae bacterium]